MPPDIMSTHLREPCIHSPAHRHAAAHASLLHLQDDTTSIAMLAMGATGVLWACIAAARDFSRSNKDATTAPLTGGTTYGTSNPSLGP